MDTAFREFKEESAPDATYSSFCAAILQRVNIRGGHMYYIVDYDHMMMMMTSGEGEGADAALRPQPQTLLGESRTAALRPQPQTLLGESRTAALRPEAREHPASVLAAAGSAAADAPDGWLRAASAEVSVERFASGHVWVPVKVLKAIVFDNVTQPGWPRLWEPVRLAMHALWHGLTPSATLTLYHGTTPSAAHAIMSAGQFQASKTPGACTGECPRRIVCTCGPMLGSGVYLAHEDKACSNAGRAAGLEYAASSQQVPGKDPPPPALLTGCVIECEVQLGRCRVADADSVCACGCKGAGGVDHLGSWHPRFDSVYVAGGLPAAKRPEWCVKDPGRVRPLRSKLVWWTHDRALVREGEWTADPQTDRGDKGSR